MAAHNPACHVTVIGAGIVGICCALKLRRDGHRVTVLDPKPPGTATSFGNAGIIAIGSIIPYSTPDLWKTVPAMLLDPLGPVRLRWRHLPRAAPWLARFVANGRASRFEAITAEMAPLVAAAHAAHAALISDNAIDPDLMRPLGYLYAFRDERKFEATSLHRELLARHGVAFAVLDGDEIGQLEPGLSAFRRGLLIPDGAFVTEPVALTRAYAEAFLALGGEIRSETVRGFEIGARGPEGVVTDGGRHDADRVVVAAGAWSRTLARMLGSDAPLEAKRGYHLSLPRNGITLNRPVIVGDHNYTLCPMRDGVRVTAGVEFGGLELAPDYRRIRRLLADARRSLPGLGDEVAREWMGHRPALPDSKPVIARSPRFETVFFAFGHGHLGLTLGAVTGQAIADLVAGRPPPVPLAPFAIDRFRAPAYPR
jgi:D-amino-acid dehydrogenase